VVVELAIGHLVDCARDERMKLHDPLGIGVLFQSASGYGGEMWQVIGLVDGFQFAFIVAHLDLNVAAGKDIQRENDFLIGARMAALPQFLAQHVKAEHDAAAEIGFVEIAALLLGGYFAQRVFDQLFIGAGKIFASFAVDVFDARGFRIRT
jgi:hypothetical protein